MSYVKITKKKKKIIEENHLYLLATFALKLLYYSYQVIELKL